MPGNDTVSFVAGSSTQPLRRANDAELRVFVPRVDPGCELKKLPLTPSDAFVLSRVDGNTDASMIGTLTGFGPDVEDVLRRLFEQGALIGGMSHWGPRPQRVSIAPAPLTTPAPPPLASVNPPKMPSVAPSAMASGSSPPIAAEEASELEPELKKRIDRVHRNLEVLTHYEVLEIQQAADKKAIKSAYYRLAAEFHPDKHFRKQLGGYRAKLEALFKRVTEAHDVLTTPKARAEYDAYLEERENTEKFERFISTLPPPEEAGAEAPPPLPRPPSTPSSPIEAPMSGQSGLRVAYAEHKRRGSGPPEGDKDAAVRRYVQGAEDAVMRSDFEAAASFYRLAWAEMPNDETLRARLREWEQKASEALAAAHCKQGDYEARRSRWELASNCYLKAVMRAPNDATVLHRAADSLLRCGADLHEAMELAVRAVHLAPSFVAYRVTLAQVHLALGDVASARAELEATVARVPRAEAARILLEQLDGRAAKKG
jgi:curved DNA-binding protein CbpA